MYKRKEGGRGGKKLPSPAFHSAPPACHFPKQRMRDGVTAVPTVVYTGMGKGNSSHLVLNEGFFSFPPPLHAVGRWNERDTGRKCFNTYVHKQRGFFRRKCKKVPPIIVWGNAGAAACIFAAKRKRDCNCWFLEKVARHLRHSIFCIYAYLLRNRVCFLGILCWNDFPHCFTNRLAQSIVTFPIGVVNNIVCRIPHYKNCILSALQFPLCSSF